MVDEADSKSVASDGVWVRVPPPAPKKDDLLRPSFYHFYILSAAFLFNKDPWSKNRIAVFSAKMTKQEFRGDTADIVWFM